MYNRFQTVYVFLVIISVFSFITDVVSAQTAVLRSLTGIEVKGVEDSDVVDRVKLNSGLYVGKEVVAEDFAEAVKRIWRMGTFNDVQIFTSDMSDSKIAVTIYVKENPRIDFIQFNGNDEVKNDKLAELVSFYRSQVVDQNKIRQARNKILGHYQEKGYLLAEVTIDTVEANVPDRLALSFTINEGEKVKIKGITFEGNENFSDGKLRKQFENTKQDGIFTGGDFNREEYEEDKKKIPEFYKTQGFRDAVVVGDSIYYDETRKKMFIVIQVNEGRPYYFRNISFEGNELYKTEFLETVLDIESGDKYNYEKFQKGIADIQEMLSNQGYLLANVNYPETPIGEDSLDVTVYINEGNPISINQINIFGNTKTKEKVIRRELKIKPGEKYSQEKIMRSLQDVFQLNYFADVKPEIGGIADERVNIMFKVEEKSTDTASMSAGYSQRDGMIGSLGLAMNNLFGNGQQLSLDWQFGKIFRSFQIGFTEPYLFDTPTMAGFSVYDLRRGGQFYGFSQESTGFTLRLGRKLKWPDDFFLGNWYFEYSKNHFFDIQSSFFFIGSGRTKTTRVSLTQVITRNSRRFNPEFYEAGTMVSLSNQYAGGFLGGTENFLKTVINTENYYNLPWKFVFFHGAEFGWIKNLTDDEYISPQDAFYLGGSALALGTALRGYEERSVGPQAGGYAIGAKAMMKMTSELRLQFSNSPTIYGLLFAEAGNAWLNSSYIDPFSMRKSAGAGIRLYLPMIGMLGIDFGYGFDNYDALGNRVGEWKPHFQFGKSY